MKKYTSQRGSVKYRGRRSRILEATNLTWEPLLGKQCNEKLFDETNFAGYLL